MEVPRLGVELELQLPAYTTATAMQDPRLESATYTIAHSITKYLTHWARQGIKPESSWIQVGFITTEPQWELVDWALINILPEEDIWVESEEEKEETSSRTGDEEFPSWRSG